MPEGAGSTEHPLLCSGTAEEAAGLHAVREVQGKRPHSALNEAERRSERGLIGNLDPCFAERDSLVARQRSAWGDAPLGGTSGFNCFTPMDLVTGLGEIETFAGRLYRRAPECGS